MLSAQKRELGFPWIARESVLQRMVPIELQQQITDQ